MDFVLLTAAVTPNSNFQTAVANSEIRLEQYQNSTAAWTKVATDLGWHTIVVETTGCAESLLLQKIPVSERRNITVVPFEAHQDLLLHGKGGVEAAAMDHVISSDIIPFATSTFFKTTGRLRVDNARRLLRKLPEDKILVRRTMDRRFCDTRFFGTTKAFWHAYLTGMGTEVIDKQGRYLEHVLAYRLAVAEYESNARADRFSERPQIIGSSGSTGIAYNGLNALVRGRLLDPLEDLLANRLGSKQV